MSETIYVAPKKHPVKEMRVHDYLYDSAFIVSGARDYARTSFKAAMASAQLILQPVYATMFSELNKGSRMNVVYHTNCRLPDHLDRSYAGYLRRLHALAQQGPPLVDGKDRYKFSHTPKQLLAVPSAMPDFHPPSLLHIPPAQKRARNRATQSLYRESSAQTYPWQPDGKPSVECEEMPEVMYLDKLEWGPGKPYRLGDLPADFHTTEIINKMRHARLWMELVEKGVFPRGMKKADAIIEDVETKDLIFREAEIDELQEIRLELLHRIQSQQRQKATTRCSRRLAKRWAINKEEMERKISHIRRTRDRELRKLAATHTAMLGVSLKDRIRNEYIRQRTKVIDIELRKLAATHTAMLGVSLKDRIRNEYIRQRTRVIDIALRISSICVKARHTYRQSYFSIYNIKLRKLAATHTGGGRVGQVARMREARGMGSVLAAAQDPASEMYAPLARHGYQARRRHATIYYDPSLLSLEEHASAAAPPAWLECCAKDLKHTCSGHYLAPDRTKLCERETKWSEDFLRNLHSDLKKARLGAVQSAAGPLHVLKPRLHVTPRPSTPEVDPVPDTEETQHQMYEGRTRAAELTEELKTTHGLQKEDKIRIAREEAKAREYMTLKTEAEQKEDAICALVDELTGGAVSAALDFLEKELRRLKEERRQHAFILIALREKTMREAAEAGRRQKEEHRRREHDEMFRQALGVTQETVDVYLRELVQEGVELAAEADAVRQTRLQADNVDKSLLEHQSMSTAEQNELVAELVNQFLLPATQRSAARHKLESTQKARLGAAASEIFNLLDDAEIKDLDQTCPQCGCPLGERCHCQVCPLERVPEETEARDDPRWAVTRERPKPTTKALAERFPIKYEMRRMMDTLVDEVVQASKLKSYYTEWVSRDCSEAIQEHLQVALDAKEMVDFAIDRATGATFPPAKEADYHHFMIRRVEDALARTEEPSHKPQSTKLPSQIRREAEKPSDDHECLCKQELLQLKKKSILFIEPPLDLTKTLPSEIRQMQEMRRCKCDTDPTTPSPAFTIGPFDSSETHTDADSLLDTDFSDTGTTQSTAAQTEEKPDEV